MKTINDQKIKLFIVFSISVLAQVFCPAKLLAAKQNVCASHFEPIHDPALIRKKEVLSKLRNLPNEKQLLSVENLLMRFKSRNIAVWANDEKTLYKARLMEVHKDYLLLRFGHYLPNAEGKRSRENLILEDRRIPRSQLLLHTISLQNSDWSVALDSSIQDGHTVHFKDRLSHITKKFLDFKNRGRIEQNKISQIQIPLARRVKGSYLDEKSLELVFFDQAYLIKFSNTHIWFLEANEQSFVLHKVANTNLMYRSIEFMDLEPKTVEQIKNTQSASVLMHRPYIDLSKKVEKNEIELLVNNQDELLLEQESISHLIYKHFNGSPLIQHKAKAAYQRAYRLSEEIPGQDKIHKTTNGFVQISMPYVMNQQAVQRHRMLYNTDPNLLLKDSTYVFVLTANKNRAEFHAGLVKKHGQDFAFHFAINPVNLAKSQPVLVAGELMIESNGQLSFNIVDHDYTNNLVLKVGKSQEERRMLVDSLVARTYNFFAEAYKNGPVYFVGTDSNGKQYRLLNRQLIGLNEMKMLSRSKDFLKFNPHLAPIFSALKNPEQE